MFRNAPGACLPEKDDDLVLLSLHRNVVCMYICMNVAYIIRFLWLLSFTVLYNFLLSFIMRK